MVQKIVSRINQWLEEKLRKLFAPLSPDRRVALILSMMLLFGAGSIYMTVSSIYHFGKDEGRQVRVEHMEQLRLEGKQKHRLNEADSSSNQPINYPNERGKEE